PSLALTEQGNVRATVGCLGGTPRATHLVFVVELAGSVRRPAVVGKRPDRDRPLVLADMDGEPGAGRDVLRRLRPITVELDLAARHRGLRETARLVEARRPQPLVQSHR